MTGVVVHMLIGLILFTPIGFLAGYIQHKRTEKREKKEMSENIDDLKR
jgi:hypothetical protein